MTDLKQKTIGNKSIVLKVVPASEGRKIQLMLAAMIAEPLMEALGKQSAAIDQNPESEKGIQILAGLKGIANILPKLADGDLDDLINKCKKHILVDGELFNEDQHFTTDTLIDMYDVLWFFLSETFGNFIDAVRLRLTQMQAK